MLSKDRGLARGSPPTHFGVTIGPPQPDRVSFEIEFSRSVEGQKSLKITAGRSLAEGGFGGLGFAGMLPPRRGEPSATSAAETEADPTELSLATLVSCMSTGIRTQAFVLGIRIGSLQVEAAMRSGENSDTDGGKPACRPQPIRVAVELDADVPLSAVESLVTIAAKGCLAPALGNFSGRIEIVLR